MSSATDLLFLGLPDTGKTTYLIAVDEILQTEKYGLKSNGFAKNRAYLDKAKVMWRAGEKISRTNLTPTKEPVELLVRHSDSDVVAHLIAPDVNGEFYDDQWADRRWPISYRKRLAALSGIMLFVNAGKNGKNSEITALWRNLPQSEKPTKKVWEARRASEQVKLVDLLQMIVEFGEINKPLPVAVMISAWDLIEKPDQARMNPESFLKSDWSLLHQYLTTNPDTFQFKAFGVSARGGDDSAQPNLLEFAPCDRVWLKLGGSVTKDLTLPLKWLLGWD